VKGERTFIYLGWQGRGNFGDDLLYETWRAALQSNLGLKAPLYWRDLANAAPSLIRSRLTLIGSEKVLLLGGGTTLGFANWAKHISQSKTLFGIKNVFSAGAGSAESGDQYATNIQAQDWQSWRNLKGLVLAGVRGPLTQKEVASNWCPTDIVGDPALMYPNVRSVGADRGTARTLGICLGSHNATRFDIDAVAEAVRTSSRELDLAPVVFQLADSDTDVSNALASKLSDARIERYAGDVARTMDNISGTSVFVSERLHGTVAAVSLGIPCLPLAYASKCDDFWLSVTPSRPAINPASSSPQISDAILAISQPDALSAMAVRVEFLQKKLLAAAASLIEWRNGRRSWNAPL
jgi:hypothetical protein